MMTHFEVGFSELPPELHENLGYQQSENKPVVKDSETQLRFKSGFWFPQRQSRNLWAA